MSQPYGSSVSTSSPLPAVAVVGLLAVGQQGSGNSTSSFGPGSEAPFAPAVGRLGCRTRSFSRRCFSQQDDGVEGLAAELAVVLLAVRGDVALQLPPRVPKDSRAEDALVHLALVLQVVVLHVQLQVRLVAEVPVAGGAAIHFLLKHSFSTARWSWMETLSEHLLAEGAAEDVRCACPAGVSAGRPPTGTACHSSRRCSARGGDHEVNGHVLQQGLWLGNSVALRTGQFWEQCVQVGLQVSLKAVQGRVLSTTLITDILQPGLQGALLPPASSSEMSALWPQVTGGLKALISSRCGYNSGPRECFYDSL